ncbi:hypothetical protein D3C86_1957620 [compost metagenome]
MRESHFHAAATDIDEHGFLRIQIQLFLHGQVNQAAFFDAIDDVYFDAGLFINQILELFAIARFTACTCGHGSAAFDPEFLVGLCELSEGVQGDF